MNSSPKFPLQLGGNESAMKQGSAKEYAKTTFIFYPHYSGMQRWVSMFPTYSFIFYTLLRRRADRSQSEAFEIGARVEDSHSLDFEKKKELFQKYKIIYFLL